MATKTDRAGVAAALRNPGYEIFIAGVSILSIANLALLLVVHDQALEYVIYVLNFLLSLILFLDFCYRLATAQSRTDYFLRQLGWADLLASLPLPQLKILRIFRLVKVFRLLRAYGARALLRMLLTDRAGSALLTLLFIGLLVLEFGSLAMLSLESGSPDANITSASDALWYVVATMSTVGYGDQYPVTNPGRVVGTGIIVIGVGIFGTLTGYLANLFLEPRRARADEGATPDVQARLAELKRLARAQQAAIDELEALIAKQ